jgi:hypothetical protein
MNDVGLAGSPHLAFMVLHAEFPRLANQTDIFTGAVGLNVAEERLETLVDDLPTRSNQTK